MLIKMAMDPLWILLLVSCAVGMPLCPDECVCSSKGSHALCHGVLPHYSSFGINLEHLRISDVIDYPFTLGPSYFSGSSYSTLVSIQIRNTSLIAVQENTFAGLSNLYDLDLSENRLLSDFDPSSIAGSYSLRLLSFSGSKSVFTNVSGPIIHSNHLTELDLSRCGIKELHPDAFSALPALNYLVLSDNELTTIPAGTFDYLTFLEDLDLSGNRISFFPSGMFFNNEELAFLKLRENPLSLIPDSLFSNHSALTEIDLSGTMLEYLALPSFGELETLRLNGSYISSIDNLSKFPSLRHLNLSDTNLITFSEDSFVGNQYLETLILSGNLHLKLPKKLINNLTNLYLLDLSYCGLENLDTEIFYSMYHIATLNISHNNFSDAAALGKVLYPVSNLRVLDLSYNNFRTLERGDLPNKRGLTSLILRGNPLIMQPSISDFPGLRRLDVSKCTLTRIHLPNIFLQGSKLRYVYFTDNSLYSLFDESLLDPEDYDNRWYPPEHLNVLELTGNPWACDPPFTSLLNTMIRKGIAPSNDAPPQLVRQDSPRDYDEEWHILERAACENPYYQILDTYNTEITTVEPTFTLSAHLLIWSAVGIGIGMCLLLTLTLLKAFGCFSKKRAILIQPTIPPKSGKIAMPLDVPTNASKKVKVKDYQRLHEDRSPGSPTTPRIYRPPPGTQFPYPELDIKEGDLDENEDDYHDEPVKNLSHPS